MGWFLTELFILLVIIIAKNISVLPISCAILMTWSSKLYPCTDIVFKWCWHRKKGVDSNCFNYVIKQLPDKAKGLYFRLMNAGFQAYERRANVHIHYQVMSRAWNALYAIFCTKAHLLPIATIFFLSSLLCFLCAYFSVFLTFSVCSG